MAIDVEKFADSHLRCAVISDWLIHFSILHFLMFRRAPCIFYHSSLSIVFVGALILSTLLDHWSLLFFPYNIRVNNNALLQLAAAQRTQRWESQWSETNDQSRNGQISNL